MNSQWIPVSRELPDEEISVLGYNGKTDSCVIVYLEAGRWVNVETEAIEAIDYWQHLPEAPQ